MGFKKDNERYYMASVRLGPKGQIVIPKDAREMFGLEPGDQLVLLADRKKGYRPADHRQAQPHDAPGV